MLQNKWLDIEFMVEAILKNCRMARSHFSIDNKETWSHYHFMFSCLKGGESPYRRRVQG